MRNSSQVYQEDNRRGSKPKGKIKYTILSLFLVGMVCLAIGGYMWMTKTIGEVKPPDLTEPPPDHLVEDTPDPLESARPSGSGVRREGVYTVILGGTDLDDYHTDTLMVATLDSVNHTLDVLSVPRDTQVDVSWNIKKINAAWGVGKQDITMLKDLLQTVIGFKPDNYVIVDLKGFVRLVDAIDGVDYDVPRRMSYRDPDQNLYIDLQPGMQHLSGDEAIQLVRYRKGYAEGDSGRIALQQDFMKEVFKQVIAVKNVFKIPEFIDIANENVRSDLSTGSMIWFMQQIMEMEDDAITFHVLPGNPSAYYKKQNYYIVDADKAVELVNQYINPYTKPITADKLNVVSYVDYYN